MNQIERRGFMKGAAIGALAFTVGGAEVMLTARQARAQSVPFKLLQAREAELIEAVGETLVPGARQAGIAHFIDQQLSVPPEDALLEARIVNIRPPYANFYRAAIGAIDGASARIHGRRFASLASPDQREFVNLIGTIKDLGDVEAALDELRRLKRGRGQSNDLPAGHVLTVDARALINGNYQPALPSNEKAN